MTGARTLSVIFSATLVLLAMARKRDISFDQQDRNRTGESGDTYPDRGLDRDLGAQIHSDKAPPPDIKIEPLPSPTPTPSSPPR